MTQPTVYPTESHQRPVNLRSAPLQPISKESVTMCIELHTRYRHCKHTRLLHWTYCPVLTPSERQPSTGRACRRYKLRYKQSNAATASRFECKVLDITGWGAAAARSPTLSLFAERSPTSSTFAQRSPTFSMFRSPTFSASASSAGLSSVGTANGEGNDSEVSVAASDKLLSPGSGKWWASGDSKEVPEKELVEETKEGGVKGWFKKRFKAREGYDGIVLGFQTMDA